MAHYSLMYNNKRSKEIEQCLRQKEKENMYSGQASGHLPITGASPGRWSMDS